MSVSITSHSVSSVGEPKIARLRDGTISMIFGSFSQQIVFSLEDWRKLNDAVLDFISAEEIEALDKLTEEGTY